ncbi:aminoacyl-tRNA hydrolase [Elusimicrobiota bacterium]
MIPAKAPGGGQAGKKLPDIFVVGLGNPEPKYFPTRHNLGFRFIDKLIDKSESVKESYFSSKQVQVWQLVCGDTQIMAVKPMTYMNNSGEAIGRLKGKFGSAAIDRLLVAYDDVSIELGMIRLRTSGSSGGHRGMDSVIAHAKTKDFARLRLGIGPKPVNMDSADFVLSTFKKSEENAAEDMLEKAMSVFSLVLSNGIEYAISRMGTV